jgi:hypothetical protein
MLLALPLAAQPPAAKKAAPTPAQYQQAAPAPAQTQQSGPRPNEVQKLFVLKYADPNQIRSLISIFTGSVTVSPAMHAIAVSATPGAVAAIDDAIKRLDVPSAAPQNVELLAYLIVGSQADVTASSPLPRELDGVVGQLRSTFTYRNYRLMDVLSLRTRTGQQWVQTTGNGGSVQIGGNPQPILTEFRVDAVSVSSEGGIRLDGLRVSNRVPTGFTAEAATAGPKPGVDPFTHQDLGINTNVDLKEGQKLVIGKTSIDPNEALFVVLTARVAQ